MTVGTSPTWIDIPGNGTATIFSFPFLITAASDLLVGFIVGSQYTQQSSGYSVSGVGNSGGGQVTFTVAPPLGTIVDLRSSMPFTQPTNFANLGPYLPENTTNSVDRVTSLVKLLQRQTYTFGIHGPDTESIPWPALPAPSQRLGMGLVFDSILGLPAVGALTTVPVTTALLTSLLGLGQTAAEAAAGVTPVNFAIASHATAGVVLPERYGAVGNGNSSDLTNAALDTAAINIAITIASATGCPIVLSRDYIALPLTPQTGAANYNCAFAIKSGVTFIGNNGGSIKIQDNYSTNSSPKEMAMFSTSVPVANVSWIGLTMDMNGANNLMSPSRPATYNRFNHAAIMVNGANGLMNTVRIEDNTIKNNAGVCFVVCALVAAGTTPQLGVNWTIRNNLFLNGGTDSDDHTSVYAWCEDVLCDGNVFWQDLPPFSVGLTGGHTAYEIHGSNQRVVNNQIINYVTGCIIAGNFTNTTLNTIVANNNFYVTDWGVLFFREQIGGMGEIDGALISGNAFYFDNYQYSPRQQWPNTGIGFRMAVGFQGQYSGALQLACNNVKICNNICNFAGTSVQSAFVRWDTVVAVPNNVCVNLSVTDNQVIGANRGVYILTNGLNGQGNTEISRNQFINLTPDVLINPAIGILIDANGGFKTLTIDGNQFVDERSSPLFARGILLNNGTITDFFYGQQIYKGLTTSNYAESGVAITNRKGNWVSTGVTGSQATGNVVAHGLPVTPTLVLITQQDGSPTGVFPSAVGPTTFIINFSGGGGHAFAWQASIGSPFP